MAKCIHKSCDFETDNPNAFHVHCVENKHGLDEEHGSPIVPIESSEPDWEGQCENCGQSPTHPLTGLCGPCTFGEAETAGGNW